MGPTQSRWVGFFQPNYSRLDLKNSSAQPNLTHTYSLITCHLRIYYTYYLFTCHLRIDYTCHSHPMIVYTCHSLFTCHPSLDFTCHPRIDYMSCIQMLPMVDYT